jgi:hypothetical protein
LASDLDHNNKRRVIDLGCCQLVSVEPRDDVAGKGAIMRPTIPLVALFRKIQFFGSLKASPCRHEGEPLHRISLHQNACGLQ